MVSRLTAYAIASNPDIIATSGGPTEDGKYVGWITLGKEDRFRPLLNTEPIYETAEAAKSAMEQVIEEIKKFVEQDAKDPENPLVRFLESPEGKIVQDIVTASKSGHSEG